MKCWIFLFLVLALTCDESFADNNKSWCQKWSCIHEKFGLTDSRTVDEYDYFLRLYLTDGEWPYIVDIALDTCIRENNETYNDDCPGQGLMNCVFDMLNKNCPDQYWRKEDSCAALRVSAANDSYLFSQGRYKDFEKNLPMDRRSETFMRNYFSEKCCDLPQFPNNSFFECGFNGLLHYHVYPVQEKYSLFATLKVLALSYDESSAKSNKSWCQKWSCIHEKFGLTDSRTVDPYDAFLRRYLTGDWQYKAGIALDTCIRDNHKTYYEECPGQGLMNCVFDQLNKNCPDQYWRKEDSCATLRAPAVSNDNYMFSQGRYNDFDKNLPIERRPETFMRNYFYEKCCDLPQLPNDTLIECGFNGLVHYHVFPVQKKYSLYTTPKLDVVNPNDNFHGALRRNVYNIVPSTSPSPDNGPTTTDSIIFNEYEEPTDPLDCCDMENFIQKQWRTECDFKLRWDDKNRLTVVNTSDYITTTTQRSLRDSDIKIVPISCEKENCIFNKLNIVTNGAVDKDAFSKLLDNVTSKNPDWVRAKGRVVTQCLNKPVIGYDDDCEINKILGCTFDILTENCPYDIVEDPCKHSTDVPNGFTCQISASKYRPRHRRQFCDLPDFGISTVQSECGAHLFYKLEYVPKPPVKTNPWYKEEYCDHLTESSRCILKKMDVLNKYGFIDRFKMRRNIGLYSAEFPPLFEDMYKAVFETSPLYRNHCSASRKFLNVIDSMFMSCPIIKFKNDEKCTNLVKNIRSISDLNTFKEDDKLNSEAVKTKVRRTVSRSTYRNRPIYNFGILGAGNIPKVEIIDVKPTEKTLVLLPVYSRMSKDRLAINSLHNDGVFRS